VDRGTQLLRRLAWDLFSGVALHRGAYVLGGSVVGRVVDVRAEKTFNLTSRLRFRGFFDLFNIANSSTSETLTRTTGPNYLRPSAILAPRTARIGFRFLF